VDVNEALISSIDPKIAGSPEFIVKHRAIAGAVVHEAAHARFSTRIDLPKISKTYGARHAATLAMLEEGRCEAQQWEHLSGVEQLALQSMVLEIVLRDMQNDEGETPEMNIQSVVRLMGLIAARIDKGIVDITQPMGKRMADALLDVLGADYGVLYDIAVRFAGHSVSWYSGGDEDLHKCVAEWIAIEDRLFPEPEGEGQQEGEGEGEGGEGEGEGSGKSKSKSKGKSSKGEDKDKSDDKEEGDGSGAGDKSDDESDKDGDGDGDGKGEGEDGEDAESLPGEDDDGTVGDGSHTLDPDLPGEASLGDYASSNVDAGQFEDLFNAIRDAADEAGKVGGSRLREEVVAIHKATAASHADRRRKNAAAMSRWK
jgi:hypothetical protein